MNEGSTEAEEREARTFVILAITGSVSGWNLAFKLGTTGEIPFDVMLTVWAAATAALLASLFWPRQNSIINWWNRLALLTPSIWFVIQWMDINIERFSIADEITFLIALVVLGVCVPYTVILLLSITNRELFQLKSWRLRVGLVIVIASVLTMSFLFGYNHDYFVTCEDFNVVGDYVPPDCESEADWIITE